MNLNLMRQTDPSRGRVSQPKPSTVEPNVIDEEIIQKGIIDPPHDEKNVIDSHRFPEVKSLEISYKNIQDIDNLDTFTGLTTLRLDNNIIERICNLNSLVNLRWLDLSFNNITKIEGLDHLVNLTDLSLYHNQITRIGGGLDKLQKLDVLSLGHNNIADIREIINLRKLENLKCLCLKDNPVSQSDTYESDILSILPRLVYVDYLLVNVSPNQASGGGAGVDNSELLTAVIAEETARAEALSNEKAREARMKEAESHMLNYVEDLEESLLAIVQGEEFLNINLLRDIEEIIKTHVLQALRGQVDGQKKLFLARSLILKKRTATFQAAVVRAEEDYDRQALQMFKQFRKKIAQAEAQATVLKVDFERLADPEEDRGEYEDSLRDIGEPLEQELLTLKRTVMSAAVDLHKSITELYSDVFCIGIDHDWEQLKSIHTQLWGSCVESNITKFIAELKSKAEDDSNFYRELKNIEEQRKENEAEKEGGFTGQRDEEDDYDANGDADPLGALLEGKKGNRSIADLNDDEKQALRLKLLPDSGALDSKIADLNESLVALRALRDEDHLRQIRDNVDQIKNSCLETIEEKNQRRLLQVKQACDELRAAILNIMHLKGEDDEDDI